MTSFFPKESLRRYFLWAGATAQDAEAMASGRDADSKPFMPTNIATGSPYAPTDFARDLDKFRHELPKDGAEFEWSLVMTDPNVLTNTLTDRVSDSDRESAKDPIFIGLTGERAVGKSFLTEQLEHIGFQRIHPFNPGKALLRGYYVARGATEEEALSMTDGEFKDRPAPRDVLPLNPETGAPYTSRFMMERLGRFMAKTLGLSTTIGVEMRHWAAAGSQRILIDSVVYEAEEIRKMPNSAVLGIQVPEDKRKNSGIQADITDSHVQHIVVDGYVLNEMNGADDLMRNFKTTLEGLGLRLDDESDVSMSL